MTDFLLELRSEEIPARMQDKAREDLARLFAAELAKAGLAAAETVTYATPRRLALIARDLPDQTEAVSEETKGPRVGAPPQALEGFLRKTGLSQDQLVERDGVYFAIVDKPGRATAAVLAEAIPAVIRAFPWPKSMRWGEASISTESLRWVRPLQGIVAILGEDVLDVEVAGVRAGAATVGHRFRHPGQITIGGASDYVEKLRACHVVVDQEERKALIRERAAALAAEAGLALIEDEGLVTENAGLTEWPVPLLGRFDPAFLDVPPEVIQLTARVNQKYFVCRGADGRLANVFICTANIDAEDGGAKIVEGNRKVLAARLSDARFFYETDLKVPLADQARKLDKIVFHEKLGTVADKVERVAKLARWLVEEGIVTSSPLPLAGGAGGGRPPSSGDAAVRERAPTPQSPPASGRGSAETERLAQMAERAARLAKADLVTGMVGEFPELQGLMGGYYARAQGEDPQVADAIRDHYKPVGQGDEVPTAPVTVAVSLADKLDTIAAFFAIRELPTGSKDPFALRRATLAAANTIAALGVRLGLRAVVERTVDELEQVPSAREILVRIGRDMDRESPLYRTVGEALPQTEDDFLRNARWLAKEAFVNFAVDRMQVQQREAGVRHDLIDAVFALGGEDDLVRLLARVHALQSFVASEDGANLLTGYRRAANILKKEGWAAETPLPAGEGGARSAEPSGRVRATDADQHPHPSAASPLPPSPTGRGNVEPLSYAPEPAEAALIDALGAAAPLAAAAVEREDFEAAMAALAALRGPIDAFFDQVTVNDADPAKRAARLALLARMRDAVHQVADFSKIEG